MPNTFYIVLAYGLTYAVLIGYALRLRSRRQALDAAAAAAGRRS